MVALKPGKSTPKSKCIVKKQVAYAKSSLKDVADLVKSAIKRGDSTKDAQVYIGSSKMQPSAGPMTRVGQRLLSHKEHLQIGIMARQTIRN